MRYWGWRVKTGEGVGRKTFCFIIQLCWVEAPVLGIEGTYKVPRAIVGCSRYNIYGGETGDVVGRKLVLLTYSEE